MENVDHVYGLLYGLLAEVMGRYVPKIVRPHDQAGPPGHLSLGALNSGETEYFLLDSKSTILQ